MAGSFEPQLAPFISGTIDTQVHDTDLQPLNIVRLSDPWHVHVQWSVNGSIVPLIAGTWHVRVYAESMGPGAEMEVGSLDVAVNAEPLSGLSRSYDRRIIVPANLAGLTDGVYRITTVLTIDNGGARGMIAAFDQGPLMQFFQFP
ncbi:MAG: hypothetical protein GC179_11105 [Anaerolineaceae bacterium]|nr:hypothetical protein [Anaerolineaceae bacterium]